MFLSYEDYLDKVYGGWMGKCIGGAIGARFEGQRRSIHIEPKDFFPETIPFNDDLDLQMLWLKVLEEKGSAIRAEDLANAWLEGCWYPFNEYGLFKRNWKLGIVAPMSGEFANSFWKTGMGCPIRSEIWGYVNPGNSQRAAEMAWMDGTLDHGAQSVGAEMMFSAMAAMAFFETHVRKLIDDTIHYLPVNTPIETLSKLAIEMYDAGESIELLHERIMANAPCVEACDAQTNVPFTIAGLLYGEGDIEKTIIETLKLGYDTDCTLATAIALLGQIAGEKGIPEFYKTPIHDDLVMGIEYKRPDMTVSAVAKDTARVGCLIAETEIIKDAPEFEPITEIDRPGWNIRTEYHGLPSALPGEQVQVTLHCDGFIESNLEFTVEAPQGWTVSPSEGMFSPDNTKVDLQLSWDKNVKAISWANLFTVNAHGYSTKFGIMGAETWKLLGLFYETTPIKTLEPHQERRFFSESFIDIDKEYLSIEVDSEEAFADYTRKLGRPAVLVARELMVDFKDIIKITTPWVAYIERDIICDHEADVFVEFGHNCPIDVWVNGEFVGAEHGITTWFPEETFWKAHFKKGVNKIRVKVTCIGSPVEFSSCLREITDEPYFEWVPLLVTALQMSMDMAEVNPFILPAPSESKKLQLVPKKNAVAEAGTFEKVDAVSVN